MSDVTVTWQINYFMKRINKYVSYLYFVYKLGQTSSTFFLFRRIFREVAEKKKRGKGRKIRKRNMDRQVIRKEKRKGKIKIGKTKGRKKNQ